METRTFNITTKVSATKEQWESLDSLVSSIKNLADSSNIIEVLISRKSIADGTLEEHVVPTVVTKERPDEECDELSSWGTIEWLTEEQVHFPAVTFWRNGD